MHRFFWILTLVGVGCGALTLFGLSAANGAPQEAVIAALSVAFAVIPYCFARAVTELSTRSNDAKMIYELGQSNEILTEQSKELARMTRILADAVQKREEQTRSVVSNAIPLTNSVAQDEPDDESFDAVEYIIPELPPLRRKKAWFYKKDQNGRKLILAFVNAKGSCSIRPFDAETALALGKRRERGDYQDIFASVLNGATELSVESQPNLEEDCKQRLPEPVFTSLRRQISRIN